MADTHAFAADVVRIVCDRLAAKAVDLHHLVAPDAPFGGWLEAGGFLACREVQAGRGFCAVTRPTYGSAGVLGDDRPDDWRRRTDESAARLLRLGWKRSASVLVAAAGAGMS